MISCLQTVTTQCYRHMPVNGDGWCSIPNCCHFALPLPTVTRNGSSWESNTSHLALRELVRLHWHSASGSASAGAQVLWGGGTRTQLFKFFELATHSLPLAQLLVLRSRTALLPLVVTDFSASVHCMSFRFMMMTSFSKSDSRVTFCP